MSSLASAEVISLAARRASPPDFRGVASAQLRGAREKLGVEQEEFAELLSDMTGWDVDPDLIGPWEQGRGIPAADVLLAARHLAGDEAAEPSGILLGTVPHGFPAQALAGYWVTCFDFAHAGVRRYHADVALIRAESDRCVRVTNHSPAPRTEGRASPFLNEIEAQLASRHLVGCWRNTSDLRYFGSLHLAVLPGETIMDGYYTGFASDIQVSEGNWKWVRLDTESTPQGILREPAVLHGLIAERSQNDPPLTLSDVREDA
jgi:transcriptional regulator with XRE-family HTH domain